MKNMVEKFLCPGCVNGSSTECGMFSIEEQRCKNHVAGTIVFWRKIILGMPKGFNISENTKVLLYKSQEEQEKNFVFDIFNLPVWVYKEENYLFVKVLSPRVNKVYIMVIENGDIEKIKIENGARGIDVNVEDLNFKPLVLNKKTVKNMS